MFENFLGTEDPAFLCCLAKIVGNTSCSCTATFACLIHWLLLPRRQKWQGGSSLLVSCGKQTWMGVNQALQVGLRNGHQHNEQHTPNITAFNSYRPE